MPITDVSMANSALIEIGLEPITSLDDDDRRAAICKRLLSTVKEYVLISHPWVFAQKRASLSAIDEDVSFGYDYQFQLPSDCLRVVELDGNYEYKIEGDRLLTDESSVKIRYIQAQTGTSKLTANYAFAVSYLLAAKICYALVQNRELANDMAAKYASAIREARSIDAQAMGSPEEFDADEFINARY